MLLLCLTSLKNPFKTALFHLIRVVRITKPCPAYFILCMEQIAWIKTLYILYIQTLSIPDEFVYTTDCSVHKLCFCTHEKTKDAFTCFCLNEPSKWSPGGYHGNMRWDELRRHQFYSLVICTWSSVQGAHDGVNGEWGSFLKCGECLYLQKRLICASS